MFHFVANLRRFTVYRGRGNRRFDAYLLSADYVDDRRDLARKVVGEHRVLCADNGNVDLIRGIAATHKDAAAALDRARKQEERNLPGRYVRPSQLSAGLRSRYATLAAAVANTSEGTIDDAYVQRTLATQILMRPTYVIGMEDFAIVTMTALSMEPEYTGLPPAFYEARIDRAVAFAKDTQEGKYGPCPATVYAGLHGIDYDSSYLAGSRAAQAGIVGIATGLVGALQDKNYVDFRVQDGTIVDLPRATARPYMRVLEIATGLHKGFRDVTGNNPRFHALGAGSPILLPLLGLLGDGMTYCGTDSTAPIVDGWISPTTSLYVDKPAPMKLKAHRIAESWLDGGRGWDCVCPYCREFRKTYPPDLHQAKGWWASQGKPRLTKYSLYRNSPLSALLPLLSRSSDPVRQKEAAMARVGHNHWVLKRLEGAIRRKQKNTADLRRWVEKVVQSYLESPAPAGWKESARQAWLIADAFAATRS